MHRLTLEPDPSANDADFTRLNVYPSSQRHTTTDAPLVSVTTRGLGMRLTEEQVRELRDWLTEWLDA